MADAMLLGVDPEELEAVRGGYFRGQEEEAAQAQAGPQVPEELLKLEAENEGLSRELAAHREGTLGALRAQDEHFSARLDEAAGALQQVALAAESERAQLREQLRRELREELRKEELREGVQVPRTRLDASFAKYEHAAHV